MTDEPMDVDVFVAQLADDEHVGRALAQWAALPRLTVKDRRTALDRVVARALVALLECHLRGFDPVADGRRYEAALYDQLGGMGLEDSISYGNATEIISAYLDEGEERDQ